VHFVTFYVYIKEYILTDIFGEKRDNMGKMQDAGKKMSHLAEEAKEEINSAGEKLKNGAHDAVEKVEDTMGRSKTEVNNRSEDVANNANGMGRATDRTEHESTTYEKGNSYNRSKDSDDEE